MSVLLTRFSEAASFALMVVKRASARPLYARLFQIQNRWHLGRSVIMKDGQTAVFV
jgi:hypothetical protein